MSILHRICTWWRRRLSRCHTFIPPYPFHRITEPLPTPPAWLAIKRENLLIRTCADLSDHEIEDALNAEMHNSYRFGPELAHLLVVRDWYRVCPWPPDPVPVRAEVRQLI